MDERPDFRVLFPTSFSTASVHAGRAIRQLADGRRLSLTIMHVMSPRGRVRQAQARLDAFLADIDGHCEIERLLVQDDGAVTAVAELCRTEQFDLVMAPSSGRSSVHGLLAGSFRAQLLQRCCVPLWTVGDRLASSHFVGPLRTVACLVDFDDSPAGFIRLASAFADRVSARLRVLSVVPTIDEGTLAHVVTSDAPLLREHAVSRIHAMLAGCIVPDIDIAVGDRAQGLRRMLDRASADLLFVGPRQARFGSWLSGFDRVLDRLPCPVVCVDAAASRFPGWSFQDTPVRHALPGDRLIAPGHI